MEHKIHYTSQAHRDVDEIWGYIAYDLQNETAAYRVVNEIFDTIDEQLELFSESGARVSLVFLGTCFRWAVTFSRLKSSFFKFLNVAASSVKLTSPTR